MDGPWIQLVGPLAVRRGGRVLHAQDIGSRKARTMLALLASARRRVVTVDRIVAVLWPGEPPRDPAGNVATLVSRIRGRLGAEVLTGGRTGYRLGDRVTTDVLDAEMHLGGGDAEAALAILAAGEVLANESEDDWVLAARADQAETVRRARHRLAADALRDGRPEIARDTAAAALAVDAFDEEACRTLMRAFQALGEPVRALNAYDELRSSLDAELGVDPAAATQAVHVAILRGGVAARPGLAGRDDEVDRLSLAWREAMAGRGGVVLISGEAGIGKTRLADELARAARHDGRVVVVRCYQAERSLFLQPIVDALEQLGATLPEAAAERGSPGEQRRRTYAAAAQLLRAHGPILLVLDDLQHAGAATVDLLHYLARRGSDARLLVVATIREEEGRSAISALAEVADVVRLGALDAAAIGRMATAAGHPEHAEKIARRTRGHTLFVVETLRALSSGEPGLPESLRAAVLARAAVADEEVLRAAAVLGPSFSPPLVAGLLGVSPEEATRRCERLLAGRLTVVAGRSYEFANDLIQEALYESTPEPTRLAHHLRAADLLAEQPEAAARHAAAGGDDRRAARAWLAAGAGAAARYATADAEVLIDRALDAAGRAGDEELLGRCRLARGRVREAGFSFDGAIADYTAAMTTGRAIGDRRLEMAARHELGGPAWAGSGRPAADGAVHIREGLRLAEQLGDRGAEARMLSWLTVLECNELRFTDAFAHVRRATAAAAAAGDETTLIRVLDARKTTHAYLGQVAELTAVLSELEPRVRRSGDLHLLQWCVFESSFPHLAAGRWVDAEERMAEAIRINRRSGYTGYRAWFEAHRGWLARLSGRLDDALAIGARAVAMESHAWFTAAVLSLHATSLLAAGRAAEATPLLERGLEVCETHGTRAYRLRCLAPLAEATGSAVTLRAADGLLREIEGPPWLYGADAYAAVARAWHARGDHERARQIESTLHGALDRNGWVQISSASNFAARSAPSVSTGR